MGIRQLLVKKDAFNVLKGKLDRLNSFFSKRFLLLAVIIRVVLVLPKSRIAGVVAGLDQRINKQIIEAIVFVHKKAYKQKIPVDSISL